MSTATAEWGPSRTGGGAGSLIGRRVSPPVRDASPALAILLISPNRRPRVSAERGPHSTTERALRSGLPGRSVARGGAPVPPR